MSDADVWRNVPLEILSKGRLELVDEYFAPDYVEHGAVPPGMTPDRDGVRTFFAAVREAFPDLKAEVVQQFQDGDKQMGHIRCSGTMDGDFLGMPASHKKATWEEMHIGRMRDGQIVEHWGIEDQVSMMRQLGFLPDQP